MFRSDSVTNRRLQSLESHLQSENPVLLDAVRNYRDLDWVAHRMGLLEPEQSYAMQIPWWPLISVLGTFSSGKSTFINHYLGTKLQSTGNQAVDDKFTVICHSQEEEAHTLPGLALDADPRFPFYQISEQIEQVAGGEGLRVDAYLQLKTCPSDVLKGKILIDSPGFDADEQRTSTLQITEHIINLSDLVLVFFDARHPEPRAMQDTLEHLVENSISRADSSKFLYILNQIDTTAREDNPEEVFGAWQRALAQKGLSAGRFYTVYNADAAMPIQEEMLRKRFETKRDADLAEINRRIHQVEIERSYRIVGALERTARKLEQGIVPLLTEALQRWRRRVLIIDGVLAALLMAVVLFLYLQFGTWEGLLPDLPWFLDVAGHPMIASIVVTASLLGLGYLHYRVRQFAAARVMNWLRHQGDLSIDIKQLLGAFAKNTRFRHSLLRAQPVGWGRRSRKRLHKVIAETDNLVQKLNDKFANPSGTKLSVKSEGKGAV